MKNYSVINRYLEKEPDPAFARRAGIVFKIFYGFNKDLRVLDCGCGRGFYLKVLSEAFPKFRLYGTDLNKTYLEKANNNINNSKVKLKIGNIENLPYKNSFFDVVIASEILEHVDNDSKAIREIFRVLKRGGKAIITVPNKNYPFLWDPLNWVLERFFKTHIPSNIWWLAGIWADHKRLYNESELGKKIQKCGFNILNTWKTTHYCLPFSHFLFYGIGKNLVELGFFQDFNRFSKKNIRSSINTVVLFPVRFIDKFNDISVLKNSSVNIIFKIEK